VFELRGELKVMKLMNDKSTKEKLEGNS